MKRNPYLVPNKIFQNIIDALPVFLFWMDKNHVVLGHNLLHANNYGFQTTEEAIGMTMREFLDASGVDNSFYDQLYEEHTQIMQSGKGKVIEYLSVPCVSDGKEYPYLCHKQPLFNEKNEVIGLIGISVNISELKQTQTELIQANVKAEAASKSKSEFIANMSHDIRTPITGIVGMVQELLNSADRTRAYLHESRQIPPTKDQLLDKLDKVSSLIEQDGDLLMGATDELLRLCNEILETVSLESGKVSEKLEAFDIRELIQRNIDLLKPVAENKKLAFSAEVAGNVPRYLKGLRTYIERVILNLTSNALKFTNSGYVKIIVRLEETDADKEHPTDDPITLIISVEDSGIGIPSDKFETIFEHFSRLTPSFEGVYKGSGLGLYTVKQYMKALKGVIKVASEPNKGSRFIAHIPLAVSDHSDYHPVSIRPTKPLSAQSKLRKPVVDTVESTVSKEAAAGHILIVEDNHAAAIAIKMLLLSFNCTIDIAQNGQTGLEKAKQGHYDLILMDIGLPDMDGLTATQKIRSLPQPYGSVPIVALTGHLDKRDDCLAVGMQDLLSKPAKPLALESILQRYVFALKAEPKSDQKASPVTDGEKEDKKESLLPLIDWIACVRMYGGNEADANELLQLNVEELKRTKAILEESYKAKDTKALREELHRCIGGVCFLRLPRVEHALKTFQNAVKAEPQDPIQVATTYDELKNTIHDFLKAYDAGNLK